MDVDRFSQKLVLHATLQFSNNIQNLNDIICLETSDGAKGIVLHKGGNTKSRVMK
jgi:hypothetical protein